VAPPDLYSPETKPRDTFAKTLQVKTEGP
jgi:hypothetical protein